MATAKMDPDEVAAAGDVYSNPDDDYHQQQVASFEDDHKDANSQHLSESNLLMSSADQVNPADHQLEIAEDTDKVVWVVDPTKEYASSSEEDDDPENDDPDASDGDLEYDHSNQNSNPNDEADQLLVTKSMPEQAHHIPRLHLPVAETAEGFKNLFFCQFCDTAYVDQEDCFDHESGHDALNPHQCNFCAFSCASRNTVVAHIKECHEPEKPFICVMCEKRFGRRSDLRKHSIVHTGIRPFGCPVCGKNFSRNTNLTKHLRIHSGLKPHVCQQCPRSFTTRADLLRHTQVHSEIKPFQCSHCPATYSRRYKFLHHEKTHHGVQSYQEEGDMNETGGPDEAGDEMANGEGVDGEEMDEEAIERYDSENMVISLDPFTDLNPNAEDDRLMTPPPVANSVQRTNVQVPAPMMVNDVKPELPPPQPVAAPTSNISTFVFQDHIQEITFPGHVTGDAVTFLSNPPPAKPKKFACDHCPKRFATQSSLQNHKNIHLGVRNHVCAVCQKCFVRKRELDRHSVIHTGHKPFACVHCPKRFGRKDKLVRHERIHMEEKMFACTTCPMTFNRRDGLLLHMRTHLKHEEAAMNLLLAQQQHHQNQMMNHQARLPQILPPALTLSSIPPPAPTMMVGMPSHPHLGAQLFAGHDNHLHQQHEDEYDNQAEIEEHHQLALQQHQLQQQLQHHHQHQMQHNFQQHHLPPTQLMEMKQEFFS